MKLRAQLPGWGGSSEQRCPSASCDTETRAQDGAVENAPGVCPAVFSLECSAGAVPSVGCSVALVCLYTQADNGQL